MAAHKLRNAIICAAIIESMPMTGMVFITLANVKASSLPAWILSPLPRVYAFRMSYIVKEYTKILPSDAMPTHPLLRPVRDFGLKNSRVLKSFGVTHHDCACLGLTKFGGVLWGSIGGRVERHAARSPGATVRAQKDTKSDGPRLPSPVCSSTK